MDIAPGATSNPGTFTQHPPTIGGVNWVIDDVMGGVLVISISANPSYDPFRIIGNSIIIITQASTSQSLPYTVLYLA